MAKGYILHMYDPTTCGGRILEGAPNRRTNGTPVARMGDKISCGKDNKTYQIIGGISWIKTEGRLVAGSLDSFSSCPCNAKIIPQITVQTYESRSESKENSPVAATPPSTVVSSNSSALAGSATLLPVPVFAKSRERGAGNTDAGKQQEPHTNFAEMGLFRAAPAADAVIDSDAPQHAQTAKKKPKAPENIPKPKKRSALYKSFNGNHEEVEYQAAVAAAASATRAQAATAGVNVLEQIAGRFTTYGTWAATGAEVAAGGIGISVAGFLVGMMPGRLNDDEQDFIDRMRLAQMSEAPTRVRYTWENDSNGNPVPHGWHTPPGKDMVRVRKMQWDSTRQAYTFTAEEENLVTIIWTPDSSGVNTPSNTGDQSQPRLPGTILVNPLPDGTQISSTTTPAPDEKNFADYILIVPVSDIPPIYIYLSNVREGLPEKDHSYHPAPKTEEIVGISGIQKAKKKTPKQGGGGLRERWIDAKGKRIYEWDSQHGELEEYRASDGEHLGSVDYKTGNQLKPAVKGRSIKRYL
ncbi:MAG: colicin E3/pyocin S6 family cytotoxin [Enterobacter sichuanensis]|uniref:Pyocin n=2 Tax=Enterobacter TaxID=547 RepID=A0AB37VB85_ENTCL|nr:S-type pyocin domain-containing protein [Enterobacter sichuanensis]MDU5196511.1 colicin E3/pyocin S6 family cytotoxin [Enterobacter sichuanensis]MDU5348025.1 colicin E3/pyocin S6 family cytotoxin [Enterobacter sichuanensis]MDU5389122.1 colicin E3/pyocin S6 family cytotoxin [Enterobacter sichuanensis]RWT71426.1 pyocin [Enterobacter cloacae]